MNASESAALPTIASLAREVERLVNARLAEILPARLGEFEGRFARDGDMAYGALNTELFAPVRRLLQSRDLRAVPRLPGSFQESREWGNADESHQQRWMWSIIRRRNGEAIGAIAVGAHHDHHQFRLPRPPEILPVEATTPARVVEALGLRMPEFAQAQPFREWYRDWLVQTAREGASAADG